MNRSWGRGNRTANQKIGRPVLCKQQLDFKRKFQRNEKRFQIETNLLVLLYQQFHQGTHTEDPRIQENLMSQLYDRFGRRWLLELLQRNNQKYFEGTEKLTQQEKALYTSTIDVCYLFKLVSKQRELKRLPPPMSIEDGMLIIFFFLHNQKLTNEALTNYYFGNLIQGEFEKALFVGLNPLDPWQNITMLLSVFLLQIMSKEDLVIFRKVPSRLTQQSATNKTASTCSQNHKKPQSTNVKQEGKQPEKIECLS